MVGIYLLVADGEAGNKIYSGAKTGKQARIVHEHAIKFVEQSPALDEWCTINRTSNRIVFPFTDSWYGTIACDSPDSLEGLNGSVILDEAHVVDSKLARVLKYCGASREEPIELAVSSAGFNPVGWGKQQFDLGERINRGEVKDQEFLHVSYSAPQDASDEELEDPAMWHQANPSLGVTIDPATFKRELEAARESNATWQEFKVYRFGIWGVGSNPWLKQSEWSAAKHERTLDEFAGFPSYLGLDMSLTRDMTGATLIVPIERDDYDGETDHEEGKTYYLFPMLWITRAAVDRWSDKVPFDEWARSGDLRIIEGPKIDFPTVRQDIVERFGMTDVQSLSYDVMYAAETAEKLSETLDCELIQFRQSLMEYAEPTQAFERLLSLGLLLHDDNAVLNWQASHVEATIPDRSGNYRPVKPRVSDKSNSREAFKTIDGIQASVMALREARKFESYASFYEENELESF